MFDNGHIPLQNNDEIMRGDWHQVAVIQKRLEEMLPGSLAAAASHVEPMWRRKRDDN